MSDTDELMHLADLLRYSNPDLSKHWPLVDRVAKHLTELEDFRYAHTDCLSKNNAGYEKRIAKLNKHLENSEEQYQKKVLAIDVLNDQIDELRKNVLKMASEYSEEVEHVLTRMNEHLETCVRK